MSDAPPWTATPVPEWYADFARDVADGEATVRVCAACGAGALPPRSVCPECGGHRLEERELSPTATVAAHTEIHVTTPRFHGETPYTVVLGRFEEGVTLTGQLRGVDAVEVDAAVELGVEPREEGPDLLTFEPV